MAVLEYVLLSLFIQSSISGSFTSGDVFHITQITFNSDQTVDYWEHGCSRSREKHRVATYQIKGDSLYLIYRKRKQKETYKIYENEEFTALINSSHQEAYKEFLELLPTMKKRAEWKERIKNLRTQFYIQWN